MNAAFLITFREGLEAALIVGILFAAMRALGAQKQNFVVWLGVLAGVFASFAFAWFFAVFTGGFEGKSEKLYEGILMFAAGFIITHLIFWMKAQGRNIAKKMNQRVKESLKTGSLWTIGLLAAIAVAREGIETVIFFQALFVQSEESISIVSALLGVGSAIVLACMIFLSTLKVPIGKLFDAMSYFLILIAGGLIAHGVVELQGAEVIPTLVKPFYDISSILSEKEGMGAFLKAAFGYDANPSLIAVAIYWVYLFTVSFYYFKKN